MNKEETLKAIMDLPKVETNNPISAMNSISVDDLMSAIDRFNKVPTYDELLKENKQLKEEKEELKKWLEEQKQFIEDIPTFTNDIKNNHIGMVGAYQNTLDKIKELEEGVK